MGEEGRKQLQQSGNYISIRYKYFQEIKNTNVL